MALTKIPASLLDTSGGFDLQGNITLGDSEKILLGASSDLQIYHDESGGHSRIDDTGTGGLVVRGSQILLEKYGGGYMINAVADGASELYHAGNKKLETTSTGATVTGNLAVTGDLDITGDINSYNVTDLDVTDKTITLGAGQTEANSGGSGIIIDGSSASILWDETNTEFDINNSINVSGTTPTITISDSQNKSWTSSDTIYGKVSFKTLDSSGIGAHETAYIGVHADVASSTTPAGRLVFGTSNSNAAAAETMTLDGNGFLGIGTNNPLDLLHINSDSTDARVVIDGHTDYDAEIKFAENGTVKYTIGHDAASDSFVIGTTNVDTGKRISIDASGNVGIGTSNPQMGLHVGSGTQSTAALAGIGIANGGSSYSFYSASDGTKQYIAGIDHNITYTKAGSLSNHSHAIVSNNTIRLFCKNDGFLGIGDVDPDSTVHIKNSTAGGPQIHMDDGTNSAFINFDGTNLQLATQRDMVDGTWHNTAKSWGGINIKGESIGSKITMATAGNSNTSPTTHFLLDRDGHFILGSSTTEAGKLSIYTDATNDPAIYGYRSTSSFIIVPFLSNGAFSSLSSVDDSGLFFSDNFVIAKQATGDYGMKVFGNGNIAFGTGTAQSKYTFQGTTTGDIITVKSGNNTNTNIGMILFRDSGNTYCGQITANGSTHTTAYLTSSDYRLKENISYEFNALDRVAQLKPARFNWIDDDTNTLVDGFLAHEVSDIVPEAIDGEKDATKEEEYEVTPAEYEDDGETLISEAVMGTRTVPVYQGIDQSKLVPLLTKAIQELNTKLEAAEARITELEG